MGGSTTGANKQPDVCVIEYDVVDGLTRETHRFVAHRDKQYLLTEILEHVENSESVDRDSLRILPASWWFDD